VDGCQSEIMCVPETICTFPTGAWELVGCIARVSCTLRKHGPLEANVVGARQILHGGSLVLMNKTSHSAMHHRLNSEEVWVADASHSRSFQMPHAQFQGFVERDEHARLGAIYSRLTTRGALPLPTLSTHK
jgi:hypothetical protein